MKSRKSNWIDNSKRERERVRERRNRERESNYKGRVYCVFDVFKSENGKREREREKR